MKNKDIHMFIEYFFNAGEYKKNLAGLLLYLSNKQYFVSLDEILKNAICNYMGHSRKWLKNNLKILGIPDEEVKIKLMDIPYMISRTMTHKETIEKFIKEYGK